MLIRRKLRPREATVVPPAILMLKEVIMVMAVIRYIRGVQLPRCDHVR